MRILHTSDWHLGKSLVNKPRMEEQRQMLRSLYEVCESERIDLLLVCGDIFDTSVPKAEAEELFFGELVRLSALVPVVCIAGNHDDGERLRAPGPVAIYSQIYLVGGMDNTSLSRGKAEGGDGWLRLDIKGERVNLALLPYPFSSGMMAEVRAGEIKSGGIEDILATESMAAMGTAPAAEYEAECAARTAEIASTKPIEKNDCASMTPEKEDKKDTKQTNEDRVMSLIKRCSACFGEGVNIFASHLFITGSEVCEDRELGSAPLLSKSILPACDYVALGHIHKPQSLSKSRHMYYSGSPLAYSFDDLSDKYYFVFDSGDKSVKKIPIHKGTRLIAAEVDSFDTAVKALEENKDAYVKLIYRGQPLALSEVRAIKSYPCFTDIRFETKEERVATKTRADASPAELFKTFYLSQRGEQPDDELVDLFLSVFGGEYEC